MVTSHADSGVVTLDLTYDHLVTPHAVEIYETFNPGAVTLLEAYDPAVGSWVTLWQGADTTAGESGVFSPFFSPPAFKTNSLRLTLDTSAVPGFNDIDAVGLIGRP
ncbi:MAG: hypothetical protein HC802_05275 [Caldilineaceae bacterium]|nr:hypothetical protein [Caldilineaceae bacterium]